MKMEVQIILLGFFLLLVNGARIQRDAEDDCSQPPENTENVRCCEMPKRHVWGKIRETVHFCAEKLREKNGEDSPPTTPPTEREGHGFHKKYAFKKKFHDGCFMECMFEREGFLVDSVIQKEVLLERVKNSLEGYDEWKETAEAAVEKCTTEDIEISANETCRSGSAEIGKCIFKELFMECPTWLSDNEYCTSLKEFYVKCPNGPPPELFFKHPHHHMRRHQPEPEESETSDTEGGPEETEDQ